MAVYAFFGCGPSGLYSAWRLASCGQLGANDSIVLYDWGEYHFSTADPGTREPSGRICTYHYQEQPANSYVEVGGMRYIEWDGCDDGGGHRLVTTVIEKLNLSSDSVPFLTTDNPLFYLRQKHFYSADISADNPAPYNANHDLANYPPDQATTYVADQALGNQQPETRSEQCTFYQQGEVPESMTSDVYNAGDPLKNVGYWNLMIDQLGPEGYAYADWGAGYNSNAINWNAADALIYNSEFAPGGEFKTLKTGYSSLFSSLFEAVKSECQQHGINWQYHPNTRLRSIYLDKQNGNAITYTLAKAEAQFEKSDTCTADHAFLCMPPGSLEIVAEGSRYLEAPVIDVLNDPQVTLYRESVIQQPSYKIAMFFDHPWWQDAPYPPKLNGTNVFGPTITDTPLRQVYYFGDNSQDQSGKVYALLASYDDERFVDFWKELEVSVNDTRKTPHSLDIQPLIKPHQATPAMVNMLRAQLAQVHFSPDARADSIPMPLETVYMDWSERPFYAGYHAWAAHYDIDDVMQNIRKPTELIDGAEASLYIVGSAYSNDQAWVEGAFCTAESVLTDYFHLDAIINQKNYPFICRCPQPNKP